jgi:hypothetical protein
VRRKPKACRSDTSKLVSSICDCSQWESIKPLADRVDRQVEQNTTRSSKSCVCCATVMINSVGRTNCPPACIFRDYSGAPLGNIYVDKDIYSSSAFEIMEVPDQCQKWVVWEMRKYLLAALCIIDFNHYPSEYSTETCVIGLHLARNRQHPHR